MGTAIEKELAHVLRWAADQVEAGRTVYLEATKNPEKDGDEWRFKVIVPLATRLQAAEPPRRATG